MYQGKQLTFPLYDQHGDTGGDAGITIKVVDNEQFMKYNASINFTSVRVKCCYR